MRSAQVKLDADVIVVGAGPSGATIASEIAMAGVRVIVLERRTKEVESRAGTLLPRVLELFDARGIAGRFIARMNQILAFPFRPEHIYAGLKFVEWKNYESRFGFTLGLPQNHTEEILLGWAGEKGADIRHNCEVTGLKLHDDHVEVSVRSGSESSVVRGRYLVGADGGRSTVRRALQIPFEGNPGTFTGMVVDAEMPAPWPVGNFGTDNASGWMRGFAFGKDITRFNMVHRDSMKKGKAEPVTLEEVRACLRDIAGQDFGVESFRWASRYDDTMRVVPRLREGRAFLVGESARIHYPASGVGMNFCLQDAFNLGWKLAAVCKNIANETLLDTYQTERMPVVERLLHSVKAQCALQFNFSEQGVALKRRFESIQMPVHEVNAALAQELNGTEQPYATKTGSHPLAGMRAPDLDLVLVDGRLTRVGELLRDQAFLILDISGGTQLDALDLQGLPAKVVKAIAPRRTRATYDLAVMLARPDAYVAWASNGPASADIVLKELRHSLHAKS
jgi:2-polyprenyl-6-methoxyphenol hydroxylase-like FAD-dependent oxidoreductase